MRTYLLVCFFVFFGAGKTFSQIYGYSLQKDSIYFTLNIEDCAKVSTDNGRILDISTIKITAVALLSDWNNWNRNNPAYLLKKVSETKYTFTQPVKEAGEGTHSFKFLINGQYWVEPPSQATNSSPVSGGDYRYQNWLIFLPKIVPLSNGPMYEMKLNIKHLPNNTLISLKEGKTILYADTCKAGKKRWKGSTKAPAVAYISVSDVEKPFPLILENKKYTITGVYKKNQIKHLKITGSSLTNDYQVYVKDVAKYGKKMNKVSAKSQKYISMGDSAKAMPYFKAFVKTDKQQKKYEYRSMLAHPSSYFSLMIFSYNWHSYSLDSAKNVFARFSPAVKQSALGKDIALGLENGSKIHVGDEMRNFTLPDTSGNDIVLQSFKGKWIILDFWASWCGPCMANIPKIKDLMKTYSDKNCVLVGVSVDSDKAAWLNAIRREKTDWLQLCDFKAQGSPPILSYRVQGFPTYVLISPEGKIACPPTSNIDELKKYLDALGLQ